MIEAMQYLFEQSSLTIEQVSEYCKGNAEDIIYYNCPCSQEFVDRFCDLFNVKRLDADLDKVLEAKKNLAIAHNELMEALR
jgi:hypothetical protein